MMLINNAARQIIFHFKKEKLDSAANIYVHLFCITGGKNNQTAKQNTALKELFTTWKIMILYHISIAFLKQYNCKTEQGCKRPQMNDCKCPGSKETLEKKVQRSKTRKNESEVWFKNQKISSLSSSSSS